MNKILSAIWLLAAALVFNSCAGEEDDLFDMSAAERLNATSALYSARLEAHSAGWAMQYYPTNSGSEPNGRGYLLLTRFNKDGSAKVGLDQWPYWQNEYNALTQQNEWKVYYSDSYIEDVSAWEIITDNGPVLTFNTANKAIHLFSDPDTHTTGDGIEGDYEFIIVDAPEDGSYLMLKGKKRGTYNLLTPLEDGTEFEEYLADLRETHFSLFPSNAINPVYLTLNDSVYQLDDMSTKIAAKFPKGGDKITETTEHSFLLTKNADKYYLRFKDAFEQNNAQEFVYNTNTEQFDCTNEEITASITGPDCAEFFNNWLNNQHGWAISASTGVYGLSEKLQSAYNTFVDDLKETGWTVTSTQMKKIEDAGFTYSVSMRNRRNQSTVLYYIFSYEASETGITINYLEPYTTDSNKAAENILSNVPSLGSFLQSISGKYTLKSATNKLVMNSILMEQESGESIVTEYLY